MENESEQSCVSCISCGNSFSGVYCNKCGEKILQPSERTVTHFVAQVANEITSLESRLWFTLKTIICHPGQLCTDYAKGKRNPYMKPIALFLVGNLIYFLFPVLDTYNTLLQYQYKMPYTQLANIPARVEVAIQASGMTQEMYQLSYNQATGANSKLLLILLVPLMAPLFALVGWRSRQILSDHFLLALEYNIFVLYINTMLLGYCLLAFQSLLRMLGHPGLTFTDFHVTLIAALFALYFLGRAINRFYRYPWFTCWALAVITLLGSYFSLAAYRWLLFEITIRSI